MARLPHLLEKRLRAGVHRKIAHIDWLLALQVHHHHFPAVIVKCEPKSGLSVRRIDGNKSAILAVKSPAEGVAEKARGSLIEGHVPRGMIEQRVAAPVSVPDAVAPR